MGFLNTRELVKIILRLGLKRAISKSSDIQDWGIISIWDSLGLGSMFCFQISPIKKAVKYDVKKAEKKISNQSHKPESDSRLSFIGASPRSDTRQKKYVKMKKTQF